MSEPKEVEPVEDEDESAFLLYLTNGNVEQAERIREITNKYPITELDLDPNTTSIPTAEYEQLKTDAERYRFIKPSSFKRQLNVIDGDLEPLNDSALDEAIDKSRGK